MTNETRGTKFFREGKFYQLRPELGTFEINGVRMHQTARKTPFEDAEDKVRVLGVRKGDKVLDVCTGLGYSAIACMRKGAEVATLEVDENVLQLAKENPASTALFSNPKIKVVVGDAKETIKLFGEAEFDKVLHDPPRFSFAGELYSLAFYRELFRVLRKGGALFHYTGKPGERTGKSFTAGVARRLQEAGFTSVKWQEKEQGFTASK